MSSVTAVIVAVLVIAFFVVSNLYTDVLWFDQLGYLNVLTDEHEFVIILTSEVRTRE